MQGVSHRLLPFSGPVDGRSLFLFFLFLSQRLDWSKVTALFFFVPLLQPAFSLSDGDPLFLSRADLCFFPAQTDPPFFDFKVPRREHAFFHSLGDVLFAKCRGRFSFPFFGPPVPPFFPPPLFPNENRLSPPALPLSFPPPSMSFSLRRPEPLFSPPSKGKTVFFFGGALSALFFFFSKGNSTHFLKPGAFPSPFFSLPSKALYNTGASSPFFFFSAGTAPLSQLKKKSLFFSLSTVRSRGNPPLSSLLPSLPARKTFAKNPCLSFSCYIIRFFPGYAKGQTFQKRLSRIFFFFFFFLFLFFLYHVVSSF